MALNEEIIIYFDHLEMIMDLSHYIGHAEKVRW